MGQEYVPLRSTKVKRVADRSVVCASVAAADIRDQIPRKYQSELELKKLETILLYLKNRNTGMYVPHAHHCRT